MTITDKAQQYNKMFTTGTRQADNKSYVYCNKTATDALKNSIHTAHGDKFPDDWVYGIYADLMQKVTEYEPNTIDDLQDMAPEIVDSSVDMYTADLAKWLAEDNRNIYYLNDVLEQGDIKDGFQLLTQAQYMAIDEVMQEIINLLSSNDAHLKSE